MASDEQRPKGVLAPYLTPLGAWAFSLGTTIGWGSLVVTSNEYLLQAGPWGSIIGLLVGAGFMFIIARNYHYLINRFPKAGGAYTFAKEVFGFDHGFLTAWFLALTYLAVFWANATSLPLFARYFLGNLFQFGFHYTVLGYEVHFGEILLTLAAIALTAALCIRFRRAAMHLVVAMALLLTAGISACFIAAALGFTGGTQGLEPGFLPDSNVISQVVLIACISPWAFIGFENISNSAEEYAFPHRKIFRIMAIAVGTATLLYVFVMLMSVMAYPPQYGNWFEYISDLGNLSGIEALPAFYAAYTYFGDFGVSLLMLSLLALIGTSLVGNTVALSRLFHALAKDSIIPHRFQKVNKWRVPGNAVLLVAAISLVIPFFGRTAIGWIVDVTTIGATIIYGFVSAAAFRLARKERHGVEEATGIIGLVVMVIFGLNLLLPSLFLTGSLATESYFLFTAWGILGFMFFRSILSRDKHRRFGRSVIVWIGLLSLVVFFSFAWMEQALIEETDVTIERIDNYYKSPGITGEELRDGALVEQQVIEMERFNSRVILTAAGLFAVALGMLLINFSYISRWARENEEELDVARGIVLRDPLTGVKSRHAFLQSEEALNGEIESGTAKPFAVVVCDLNGLKTVNDTKGHKAGDDYIRASSRIICELFDHSPVFRVGGDEFAVIVSGRDFEERDALMQQLKTHSRENIQTGDPVIAAGLSNYMPDEDINVRTVFDRADARMYTDKRELKKLQEHAG